MSASNKLKYGGFAFLAVAFIVGIVFVNTNKQENNSYNFPPPTEVVKQYFNSWNKKDYPNMYATISDGFKKIEPTARALQDFNDYVNSQGIGSVKILGIEETDNDGSAAKVKYSVEFETAGKFQKYDGIFTLKYREGDVIKGWKLIHPYGENIDES